MSTISSSTTSTTAFGVTADTTGALVIQTGATPTTAMTIDTSQNVGIGTSTITSKLTVYGTGDQKLSLVSPNGSSTQVGINLNPSMLASESAANPAQAAIYATDSNYSAAIIFSNKTSGAIGNALTERMRINAGAPILCLSGGNTSATGTGIAFPATQSASSDANTLDDYEKGTWTPVASSSSGSISSYASNGAYTKIGRQVTLLGSITITSVGTASGQLNFTGVPFSTLNSEQYCGMVRECYATGVNYCADIYGTSGYVQSLTGGNVVFTTNYSYRFVITYQTT